MRYLQASRLLTAEQKKTAAKNLPNLTPEQHEQLHSLFQREQEAIASYLHKLIQIKKEFGERRVKMIYHTAERYVAAQEDEEIAELEAEFDALDPLGQ